MRNRLLTLTAAGLVLATAAAVGAVSQTSTASADATTPVRYAFAGDSITQYSNSWLHQMDDPALVRDGGFAMHGYTSEQVLAEIQPAPTADVLVVMVGTNDIRAGVPYATITANVEAIVDKVGAKSVMLSYVAPNNYTDFRGIDRKARGIILNRFYSALAAKHGWLVADPFAFCRGSDNSWGTDCSDDGTHPNTVTGGAMAKRMGVYIRQAAAAATIGVGAER